MDAWWPRFVTRRSSSRRWARSLFDMVERPGARLRRLRLGLGRPRSRRTSAACSASREQGRYSRIYCGGPRPQPSSAAGFQQARAACRQVLLSTLAAAYDEVAAEAGQRRSRAVEGLATCDDPSTCDQNVPNTAGAVDTPPFPWQNRGTFHQIEEIAGHR